MQMMLLLNFYFKM